MADFQHVLDRHGLWDEARMTPPYDEFGPLVNLGFLWILGYPNALDAMQSNPTVRRFVQRASRDELATFIALLATIGEAEVMTKPIAALMPPKEFAPHYSGDLSREFWDRVNALPQPQQDEAYILGVVLQEAEGTVLRLINNRVRASVTELSECVPNDSTKEGR